MKKVLILAYDFPPYRSVGGLRPAAWFENFKNNGYYPVVVTRQWTPSSGEVAYISASDYSNVILEKHDHGMLVSAPYKPNVSNKLLLRFGVRRFQYARRMLSGITEIAQYFLPLGPKRDVYLAAREYLKKEKVDIILATGDPFVMFHYASLLSKKFDIPWVADYRDPWTDGMYLKDKIVLKRIFGRIEQRVVGSTSLISTVNPFFTQLLSKRHIGKQVVISANGFDDRAFTNLEATARSSDGLKMAFVGTIYDWNPLNEFLNGFLTFLRTNEHRVELLFYGTNKNEEIQLFIDSHQEELRDSIRVIDSLPNKELIKKLNHVDLLVLFNYFEIIGTKIYDYLALRKQILFCYTDYGENPSLSDEGYRPQIELLQELGIGVLVKRPEDLAGVLTSLTDELVKHGKLVCPEVEIDQYSRQFQISKLAKAMDAVLHDSGNYECQRCLYNAQNYPDIKLDENGICDLCSLNSEKLEIIEKRVQQHEISNLIKRIKQAGNRLKYDCVVGISGGADSVYTAYVCKQQGLNPLLVHVDGGWNSAEAVKNIRACAKILALDLETVVLDWDEMSDVQRSFVVSGVLDIDLPFDNAMIAALYQVAHKHKVKFILTGHNSRTEGIMPQSYTYFKLDKRNIRAIQNMFGTRKVDSLPWIGPKQFFWYEKVLGIRMVNLLDYLDYQKDHATSVIQSQLAWQDHGAKHFENTFTKFYQSVILPEKWQIDKRVAHLSMLICSGQLTKEAARKVLEEPAVLLEQQLELKAYFVKKLHLSTYEMDNYLQNPGVSHREFPSELDVYDRYRKIYRWFKRILKFQLFP